MSTTTDISRTSPITIFGACDSQGISIPWSTNTLRGFRDWALSDQFPERGRFSFVDGELIIQMSPEYYETHNAIKVEITSVVHSLVKRSRAGFVFGDRTLLSNERARISTEPDAMFVRTSSFRSGRCHLMDSPRAGVAQELVGSPDWVLEIVSDSSIHKDTNLLRERYFYAGIIEYWVVDAREDDIDFQILVPGEREFVAVALQDGWLASPTFCASFQLIREKDDDVVWRYALLTK